MPRERINSPTDEEIIEALGQSRGLVTVAARRIGCTPQTIHNRAHKNPAIKQARYDAREALLDVAENALANAVQDAQLPAVMFTLKTIGKDRGYVERQEVSNDGRPIEVTVKHETKAGKRAK